MDVGLCVFVTRMWPPPSSVREKVTKRARGKTAALFSSVDVQVDKSSETRVYVLEAGRGGECSPPLRRGGRREVFAASRANRCGRARIQRSLPSTSRTEARQTSPPRERNSLSRRPCMYAKFSAPLVRVGVAFGLQRNHATSGPAGRNRTKEELFIRLVRLRETRGLTNKQGS